MTLLACLAIAQYVGAANMYCATAGADRAARFDDPADDRRRWPVAVGSKRKSRLRDTAPLASGGSGLSHRRRHIFLGLWADGRLPWQFALPAGIGDVMTGVLAVFLAARLSRNTAGARSAVYAWCLFGIADLVVAITMGA